MKKEREFIAPSDMYRVLVNREDAASRSAGEERRLSEDDEQQGLTLEQRTTGIDDGVMKLHKNVSNLELQIRSARSAVVWVGVLVTLVLLIFR